MLPETYNSFITIYPMRALMLFNNGGKAGEDMDRSEGKKFIRTVSKGLDLLKKLPTGKKLMQAMKASGKKVKIFCAPPVKQGEMAKENAAFPLDPSSMIQTVNRLVVPFMPLHEALANPTQRAKPELMESLRKDLFNPESEIMNRLASSELGRVLRRAGSAYRYPLQTLSNLTRIPMDRLAAMASGAQKCTQDDYMRIAVAFYEFLSPGPGCDTQVRLTDEVVIHSDEDLRKKDKVKLKFYQNEFKVDGRAVRADIMIGHEFIHAWRMMVGRRVVSSGFEEEMMTVGLGPCADWPFTENRLRLEAGHPLRISYPLSASSDYGAAISQSVQLLDRHFTQDGRRNKVTIEEIRRTQQMIERDIALYAQNKLPTF